MTNLSHYRGYPTIKYFPAGAKLDAEEYDGGRTASDIVAWAESKLEEFAEPPEIREVIIEYTIISNLTSYFDCVMSNDSLMGN